MHANWVWSNSDLYFSRDKYFNHKEYVLGDSAFSALSVQVPAFKKDHNANFNEEKTYFNTKLAQE